MSEFHKNICLKTVELARLTGQFLKNSNINDPGSVEIKGKNDFVTKFDKEVEQRVVKSLSEILPRAGFVAEEGTVNTTGERFNWLIDPIDGTTNFMHGLFPYCISIALMEYDELVVGVVYEVGMDECFYAWKDSPAFLNGTPITVSHREGISNCLIATGFPYSNFSRLDSYIELMKYFMRESHGVRRLGSAAADLAYVACGRFDAFYEYDLKPWDVAAGAFILKRAGGIASDFSGGNNFIFGGELVATNAKVYDEFLCRVKEYMLK